MGFIQLTSASSIAESTRNTTSNTEILVLNSHLRNRNGKVKTPPEAHLGKEKEGNHRSLVRWSNHSQQRSEQNHDERRASQLPLPVANLTTEECQSHSTSQDSKALWQGENDSLSPLSTAICVELGDHGRPQNAAGVVEHVDNSQCDGWCSKVSALRRREDVRGCQGKLQFGKVLPQGEDCHKDEADDESCDNVRVTRGVHSSPDDTHEGKNGSDSEEESSDIIDLLDDFVERLASGVGRWEVEQQEAEEGQELEDGQTPEVPLYSIVSSKAHRFPFVSHQLTSQLLYWYPNRAVTGATMTVT